MPSNHSDTGAEINEADMDPFDRRMAIIMSTVDEIRGEPGSALRELRQMLREVAEKIGERP